MNISWMRRAGIAFAAAAVGVVISVGSASAADGGLFTADSSGHAVWTESGDSLRVCDDYGDNKGVRAYIYRPNAGDPANGTVLIKASDKSSDGNCVAVSKNIDESIVISLKVCNYQGASITNCVYGRLR